VSVAIPLASEERDRKQPFQFTIGGVF
jgi:hypothetical protein